MYFLKRSSLLPSISGCLHLRKIDSLKDEILAKGYCPLYRAAFTQLPILRFKYEAEKYQEGYCPLYRAAFTTVFITVFLLFYHFFPKMQCFL